MYNGLTEAEVIKLLDEEHKQNTKESACTIQEYMWTTLTDMAFDKAFDEVMGSLDMTGIQQSPDTMSEALIEAQRRMMKLVVPEATRLLKESQKDRTYDLMENIEMIVTKRLLAYEKRRTKELNSKPSIFSDSEGEETT